MYGAASLAGWRTVCSHGYSDIRRDGTLQPVGSNARASCAFSHSRTLDFQTLRKREKLSRACKQLATRRTRRGQAGWRPVCTWLLGYEGGAPHSPACGSITCCPRFMHAQPRSREHQHLLPLDCALNSYKLLLYNGIVSWTWALAGLRLELRLGWPSCLCGRQPVFFVLQYTREHGRHAGG